MNSSDINNVHVCVCASILIDTELSARLSSQDFSLFHRPSKPRFDHFTSKQAELLNTVIKHVSQQLYDAFGTTYNIEEYISIHQWNDFVSIISFILCNYSACVDCYIGGGGGRDTPSQKENEKREKKGGKERRRRGSVYFTRCTDMFVAELLVIRLGVHQNFVPSRN